MGHWAEDGDLGVGPLHPLPALDPQHLTGQRR